MTIQVLPQAFNDLKTKFCGEILTDLSSRIIYSTDASAYRQMPVAVALPENQDDIRLLIDFAGKNNIPLIPRTAGTSLAGQVVGEGMIVDVSKHLNRILEVNTGEKWVRVQPGVVLDELNKHLEKSNLFFGPETSTSNRCMIGGMVGNNACGSHSLVYGSTRDHLIEVTGILSDGSPVVFSSLSKPEFEGKLILRNLEGTIYRNIHTLLSDPENQNEIRNQYPDPGIHRRNTGYAIDLLLETAPFADTGKPFNFCKLIAGSEGTLCFITEIKLSLVPLPPGEKALLCIHCNSLEDAFQGNIIALKHGPVAVELMDRTILNLTKQNSGLRQNRFFLQGDPAAILIIELAEDNRKIIEVKADAIEHEFQEAGFGFHFPRVYGSDIAKVWALRKAGLGVLSNLPGDAKPVSVIEDTAVSPQKLPFYMADFREMLKRYNLECVYHAHIATGELHLRPILNLKDPEHVRLFRTLALETAKLVKKYRGSLSGEHGDGRLRGEFIPIMIGERNYHILENIKKTWDPQGIFNPGKITATPPMNTNLRFEPGKPDRDFKAIFDYSASRGLLRAVEQCNGSADCRKSSIMGGTMCPSYMATSDEKNTTRARANILREFLTNSSKPNPYNHREIYEVMDLCLSCKGCRNECPSNVDMARLKAEFLQHWYQDHSIPLRTLLIAYITSVNKLGILVPSLFNFFVSNFLTSSVAKKILGFASERSIPGIYKFTLKSWFRKLPESTNRGKKGEVYLFADEFTNYNDVEIGMKAVKLLIRLGYRVEIPDLAESGRTFLSKGLVLKARKLAIRNVRALKDKVTESFPLIGIEPSAILSFRDEYPDLVDPGLKESARILALNCLMFDEFIMREVQKGNITSEQFITGEKGIKLHGHCHQKSLSATGPTKEMLSLPKNYRVEEIKSGCCGMAGSFGYEKEHYALSMKVGELVLLPEVRKTGPEILIAAPGTSCRQQIKDGTGKTAFHPVEILYEACL